MPPSAEALADEEGSPFTIVGGDAGPVMAVLHTVDPPSGPPGGAGRTNLYFHVPAEPSLSEGTYRIRHERLPAFRARVERVEAGGRTPEDAGYRAVVAP
jgi:hypothetical protein